MTIETIKHFNLSQKRITRDQILGLRVDEYNEGLFFEDSIYNKIRDSINNNLITLIIGNPLSGKTRIVYDTLKNDAFWNLIIPKKNKEITEYILPTSLSNILVFFDDIDDYCYNDNKSLNNLIKYIVKNQIKCIITCRRGPEFRKLIGYMDVEIFNKISTNKFNIPKFNKTDPLVNIFLEANRNRFKSDIKHFDGNWGSVFLSLDPMRRRFEKLVREEKKIPIAILIGLKLHFYKFNYESSKNEFDDSKIRFFCEKYCSETLSMYDWDQAKNELISNETELNFIQSSSNIFIEEAYLDFLYDKDYNSIDVIDSTFDSKRLDDLFNKMYKPHEKQVWGFPMTTRDYNMLIKNATNYNNAKVVFEKIEIENRDPYSYGYMMKLCEDKTELITLYKEMKRRGIKTLFPPNHTFISKFNNFNELYNTLKELEPELLTRRNSTTNRLLKLAELNPEETLKHLFFNEPKNKIYNNPVYNQILLLCCTTENNFNDYISPALVMMENMDYILRKNLIKSIIKLKKISVAKPLVEKYLTGYDLFNELGNCFKDDNPLSAMEFYTESLKYFEFLSQEQKSLTNINHLLLENYTLFSEEKKLEIIIKTHSFLKTNKKELLKRSLTNTEYLKEALLLNEIQITSIDKLQQKVNNLFSLDYFSKKTFPLIFKQIYDIDKKIIYKDFLDKNYR